VTSLPVDAEANHALSLAFLVIAALFFAVSLGWAFRERRLGGGAVALLALLGGWVAAFEEAWINAQIKLWYPADTPFLLFTAVGHPQPLYVHLVYPGFVGLGSYVVYRLLRTGATSRVWVAFWGICALDLAFELPATAGDIFLYYGPQPAQLFEGAWPFWPAFINAAGPVLGGYLLFRLEPVLSGRSRGLLVLAPPVAYAAVYGGAGWPLYTALNSDVPSVARWIASLAVGLLCAGIVRLVELSARASAPIASAPASDRKDVLHGSVR
jgi:hypothetical protein